MNKFGVMLGVAAAVTLAGCMDTKHPGWAKEMSQNRVKQAAPTVKAASSEPVAPVAPNQDVKPVGETQVIDVDTVEAKCTCAPGTKHAAPCACGGADCRCVVVDEAKPVATAADGAAAAEPEYTSYIVQRGDYLAKISKKFNVKLDALRKANPQLKNDVVMIGQKIKIPGKVEVGEQKVPEGAFKQPAKRVYTPYTGATKDYTVKSGDTLGGIAYGNGINIRQLKELNGLSSDMIRIGQTLKIPAEKVAATTKPAAAAAPVSAKKPAAETKPVAAPAEAKPADDVEKSADVAEPIAPVASVAELATAMSAPVEDAVTHVVQEGEDVTGLSIRFSVDPAEIRELNNLGPGDDIKPGQVLKLPASAAAQL